MQYPYQFTNPTASELILRRNQLDEAGIRAYFSSVLLVILIGIYRSSIAPGLHPILFGPPSLQTKKGVHAFMRKLHWRLKSKNLLSPEFGTVDVQILGVGWLTYLIYLAVRRAGTDYMHLTKALGHVAVSQLPVQYMLSLKTGASSITTRTGLTHEVLNAYHRVLARVIYVLLAAHAALYLNFFVQIGVLTKRLGDWDVRTGLMAFASLNVLIVLAAPPVREKVYHRVFYRSHILLSFVIVTVLLWHVPNWFTRFYVGQALVLWIANGVFRILPSNSCKAEVTAIQLNGGQLIEIRAKVTDTTSARRWAGSWVPGMHAYLNQDGLGPRTPFTIVDVEAEVEESQPIRDVTVKLVVRNLGGPMTAFLADLAKGEKQVKMTIEGPYGEAKEYLPGLVSEKPKDGKVKTRFLVVAGGVGATYALPVYATLRAAATSKIADVKLLWLVKSATEAVWGAKYLQSRGLQVNAHIVITRNTDVDKAERHSLQQHWKEADHVTVSSSRAKDVLPSEITSFVSGDQTVKEDMGLAVMLCGPPGLSDSVRGLIGKHVTEKGAYVDWYEEQFGLGAS